MSEHPEPTLPILLLGVVFHDARYVEDLDELQLWRWPTDASRPVSTQHLPDGDCLHHDEGGVLVGVSVHDAARRARLRLPIRLGDRYQIPPTVLRNLIGSAEVVDEDPVAPALADDAARELRGLLDAVGDLVAGSADELTSAVLADLHDRLLAAVADWADPLGIRPFDTPPPLPPLSSGTLDSWQPSRRFDDLAEDGAPNAGARTTSLDSLEAWAEGEYDSHPLAAPPIAATDAQLLALLHHARRAGLSGGVPIHVSRRQGRLEARLRGSGTVLLDAAGQAASVR